LILFRISYPSLLVVISKQFHSYVGVVRGGIMIRDGKGGDALRDTPWWPGEVSCLPVEVPY
jgi:hypothetical protein